MYMSLSPGGCFQFKGQTAAAGVNKQREGSTYKLRRRTDRGLAENQYGFREKRVTILAIIKALKSSNLVTFWYFLG